MAEALDLDHLPKTLTNDFLSFNNEHKVITGDLPKSLSNHHKWWQPVSFFLTTHLILERWSRLYFPLRMENQMLPERNLKVNASALSKCTCYSTEGKSVITQPRTRSLCSSWPAVGKRVALENSVSKFENIGLLVKLRLLSWKYVAQWSR